MDILGSAERSPLTTTEQTGAQTRPGELTGSRTHSEKPSLIWNVVKRLPP